jgi:glycosyltransferase involved in cell wall biosynthesis
VKSISIVTACFNEEENVEELYERVRAVMVGLARYRYEHIFIDNASTDRTVAVLKRLAAADPNVKILVNSRNFGHITSPMYAVTQARGDALIGIVADLQDPPELVPELVQAWEEGYSMALCIKRTSAENPLMFAIRKRYYRLINQLGSIETFENFTGFGLFDRKVVDHLISFGDPYPYFRGMIAEIGLPHKKIYFDQPVRKRGLTKNNLYTLYDMGILGIINHSQVPLRLMVFAGFGSALLALFVALVYLVYKLLFWNHFELGVAPLVIGVFFAMSIQLGFMGILGEYIGAIHTQLRRRPYVIERERVNFEIAPGLPLGLADPAATAETAPAPKPRSRARRGTAETARADGS